MSLPAAPEKTATPAVKGLRILYADDMRELCDVVKNVLSRDGHSVETVLAGSVALQRVRADPAAFDVVITDHHMPGMDGAELVQHLRQMNFPGKIVVFSSELTLQETSDYQQMKVDHILPKPIHPNVLREVIRKL